MHFEEDETTSQALSLAIDHFVSDVPWVAARLKILQDVLSALPFCVDDVGDSQ